ncbi:MAG TPA: hypothetical protein VHP14_10445 [Anaerolineales bacterium]|nr:hypothetical protein [Anaerolineales bacterium]
MGTSMMRRHYRSRVISIITSAVIVSKDNALLENSMKKASVRPFLLTGPVGSEVELRYCIDPISQFRQNGWAWVPDGRKGILSGKPIRLD